FVNDRVDVAHAVGADGVHLGQDDLPAAAARAILGSGAIIGGSAGNADELARSLADGVDYLGVGPMCPTPSQGDAGPATGPPRVARSARRASWASVPRPICRSWGSAESTPTTWHRSSKPAPTASRSSRPSLVPRT